MDKYLIILTAPSLHLMNDPDDYIEAFTIQFKKNTPLEEVGNHVDERLMRSFSAKYSVGLNDIRILAAAKCK